MVRRWFPALFAGGVVFLVVTLVASLVVKIDTVAPVIGLLAGVVATGLVAGARSPAQWVLAALLFLIPIVAIVAALLFVSGGCPVCPG